MMLEVPAALDKFVTTDSGQSPSDLAASETEDVSPLSLMPPSLPPSPPDTLAAASEPPRPRGAAALLARARCAVLYAYLPYDVSIYGKLRSPASLLLLLVAAWPGWAVRTV